MAADEKKTWRPFPHELLQAKSDRPITLNAFEGCNSPVWPGACGSGGVSCGVHPWTAMGSGDFWPAEDREPFWGLYDGDMVYSDSPYIGPEDLIGDITGRPITSLEEACFGVKNSSPDEDEYLWDPEEDDPGGELKGSREFTVEGVPFQKSRFSFLLGGEE